LFAVASLSSFRGSASRGYTLVASIYYQNSDIVDSCQKLKEKKHHIINGRKSKEGKIGKYLI
jgi:hypothetical protein